MVQWLNYVTDFFAMLPTDGREKAIDTLPPRPACRRLYGIVSAQPGTVHTPGRLKFAPSDTV